MPVFPVLQAAGLQFWGSFLQKQTSNAAYLHWQHQTASICCNPASTNQQGLKAPKYTAPKVHSGLVPCTEPSRWARWAALPWEQKHPRIRFLCKSSAVFPLWNGALRDTKLLWLMHLHTRLLSVQHPLPKGSSCSHLLSASRDTVPIRMAPDVPVMGTKNLFSSYSDSQGSQPWGSGGSLLTRSAFVGTGLGSMLRLWFHAGIRDKLITSIFLKKINK